MSHTTRSTFATALTWCVLINPSATAQQSAVPPQAAQQPAAVQPAPLQPPPGFQLNALQQTALDTVLSKWQIDSGRITTFKCSFERLEYDVAFGPARDIPLNKNKGELSFGKPDKGSFRITEINTWQAKPVPPGGPPTAQIQGDWVLQPNAVGEHWVCDGTSIFEYRHDKKQLVQRPIPPQLQGKAIADGPLPFLFGAQPQKLKSRYWMRQGQPPNNDPNQIWITAVPIYQAQAADFKQVDVILDINQMLPTHMQVHLPNGSRHVYVFDVANASINNPIARIQNWLELPRLPAGWKRIVEQMPVAQAAQPVPPPR
jgi:TIGR03009 family protein